MATENTFWAVLTPDEDGVSFRIIDVDQILADPWTEMEISKWEDAAYLEANPDTNYWPQGTAILLECKVVRPKPAGAYVLPDPERKD